MTTTLNVALSAKLQNTLGHQGAYAYAVLIDGGKIASSKTLVDGSATHPVPVPTTAIDLPTTLNGGKVYFIVQSVEAGHPSGLFGAGDAIRVGVDESTINWNSAKAHDFRYDSFEVSLLGQAGDAGNLTDVNVFGLPMSVTIAYPNGAATETRGYKVDGGTIAAKIGEINDGALVHTYDAGPLEGDFRLAAAPATALAHGGPGGASATDWVPYVQTMGRQASDIEIAGYFNGAPSVEWLTRGKDKYQYLEYHNPGVYSYKASWKPNEDGKTGTYTLTPENSQIKGKIEITSANLANSIYATLGSATVSDPDGHKYVFSGLDDKGAVTFSTDMNTGANNEWGASFVKLLVGYIGGYLGGHAAEINPLLGRDLTVDLSKNWNFDPSYAFHGAGVRPLNIEADGHNNGVPFDRYAEVFFDSTNSYGNGYSDGLMNAFQQGGPLIPTGYITSGGGQANVSVIDVTLFDDNEPAAPGKTLAETQGYTPTVLYNTVSDPEKLVAPLKGTSTNLSIIFPFNVGQWRLAADAKVELGFYTGAKDGLATFTYATFDTAATDLYQTWVYTPKAGNPTLVAAGGASPTGAIFQVNGLPYDTGINWYQLKITKGDASRTYNVYATADAAHGVLNPFFAGQAGSIAVDHLAALPPPNPATVQPQYLTSFNVDAFLGGAISLDPALLEQITDKTIIAANPDVWLTPAAPVLGTVSGATFVNWGGGDFIYEMNPASKVFDASHSTPNATADLNKVTEGKLAFGWWGADKAWIGDVLAGGAAAREAATPGAEAPLPESYDSPIMYYSNKVGGLNWAEISFESGSGLNAHQPLKARADIDGKWITPTTNFSNGTYSVVMKEFGFTDNRLQTPIAVTSEKLTFTVDLKQLAFEATGGGYLALDAGSGEVAGNWIKLLTVGSSLPNGTLLVYATDSHGNLIGRDGATGDVVLDDAVLARIGAVAFDNGSTLFSGEQSVYLPVGQQLRFAIETGNGVIEQLPGVQVSGDEALDVVVSGAFGTLRLDAVVDNTLSAEAQLASSQRSADQAWLYLTQGSTVSVDVAGSAWNYNTIHFVRLDVDPSSGDLSVGGVGYGNSAAFRAAVRDNWDPGIAVTGGRGDFRTVADWTVSTGDGYYVPVLATEGGDTFVVGNANVDGLDHIRNYGQSIFGFEDLRADQNSDFDYNDLVMKVTGVDLAI